MTEAAALISAITALCAVVLAPLVSMYVVQKQVRVSVLSVNRQAWINQLREVLAEYLAAVPSVYSVDPQRDPDIAAEKLERVIFLSTKTRLMLNPLEDDHAVLISLLDGAAKLASVSLLGRQEVGHKELKIETEKVIEVAQKVLKAEWVRVKQTR